MVSIGDHFKSTQVLRVQDLGGYEFEPYRFKSQHSKDLLMQFYSLGHNSFFHILQIL